MKRGVKVKENLIKLTSKLASEGFTISGMEVESIDLVKITFEDFEGLELIVNNSYAQIVEGKCNKEKLKKLQKLVSKIYTIKDDLQARANDMFSQLLNAS